MTETAAPPAPAGKAGTLPAGGTRWTKRLRLPRPVAALALSSALIAVALSQLVFPLLFINNDEPINRLFADAIAHGTLFPPTFGLPDAFRPWLAAIEGEHYVLKYAPVVPAMMALSVALTGGIVMYLAVLAGAFVAMTYVLAKELLGDRNEALVAAALVALSPLVLVQSALLLSYLPTLLLLEVFAWGLVRGLSTDNLRLLALGGLAAGLAFFARSYDAVIFGLPFGLWAIVGRFGRRPRMADIAAFSLPALGGVAAFLVFNRAATGDIFTPRSRSSRRGTALDSAFAFCIQTTYPGSSVWRRACTASSATACCSTGGLREGRCFSCWLSSHSCAAGWTAGCGRWRQ